MKDLITDLRDLDDELLVRKTIECRQRVKGLERCEDPDVVRARKNSGDV